MNDISRAEKMFAACDHMRLANTHLNAAMRLLKSNSIALGDLRAINNLLRALVDSVETVELANMEPEKPANLDDDIRRIVRAVCQKEE